MTTGLKSLGSALMVLLLLAGGALWWRRRPQTPAAVEPGAPRWLLAAIAVAGAVVAALFVEHSIRYPDGGWDARAIWNLRARMLYGAPDRLTDVFPRDIPEQHPDYPLLLPGLVAHLWFAAGARTPLVPIGVSAAFAVAGIAVLYREVARERGKAIGLCAALLLLGTPDFLILAWNQYADLKVAMLLLVAMVLASEGRHATAGLVAGLAAYTKNEGLVEVGALLIAIAARAGLRQAARFVSGALAPLALLAYFKLRWAPPNDLLASTSVAAAASRAPRRGGLVLQGFLAQLTDFPHWGCALPVVAVAWVARWRSRERGRIAPLFVALTLASFFAIYLVTPRGAQYHLESSLDRLIFQLWPTMLYASALSLFPAEPRPR
jgi:hypothetical protein